MGVRAITYTGSKLFAAPANSSVRYSTDFGESWHESGSGITGSSYYDLLYNNGVLYLSVGGNVYISTNDGANWSFNITGGTYFFADNNKVFASGVQNVYVTTNSGLNWSIFASLFYDLNIWANGNNSILTSSHKYLFFNKFRTKLVNSTGRS
jgi:hypothetical protein